MVDGVNENDIRLTLEKILASRSFSRSPLLTKFLRFVVESTLDGHGNQIKEYTVGLNVLDKPHHFNPQLDASVRINAIRLRKMLAEFYEQEGNEGEIRIELPKGTYHPRFSQFIKGAELITEERKPVPAEKEDTICLLPFSGFIEHPLPDFSIAEFCELLSEKLALFQDIKVVPFDTVVRFMHEGGKLENIGHDLGVSHYITGSIELDEQQIRVSYQLFEAESNVFVRSQQTEASLLTYTVMQAAEKISSQIVSSLAGYRGIIHYSKLKDIHQPPPASQKSANAIFWFYHNVLHHTPAFFYKAIQKLEELTLEEEDCALCHAILAHFYVNAVVYNYKTAREPIEAARSYMEKALQIDPNCQHAHIVMAWLHLFSGNKAEALKSIETTVTLNPYAPDFWSMCSLELSYLGEYDKSLEYLEKSRELNPVPYWLASLPELFWALKNNEYEKMLFYARKISTPKLIFEHIFEMVALYYLRRTEELKKLIPDYLDKYPTGLSFVEQILPKILLDGELAEKIIMALKQIEQMEEAKTADS